MTQLSIVFLKPVFQSPENSLVQIHREIQLDSEKLFHMASGNYMGMVVNKMSEFYDDSGRSDVTLSVDVGISDGRETKQERRGLDFYIRPEVEGRLRDSAHILI